MLGLVICLWEMGQIGNVIELAIAILAEDGDVHRQW